MTTPRQPRHGPIRRYVASRFGDLPVELASPHPPRQVAAAIAAPLKPLGGRAALALATGGSGVYGWVVDDRVVLDGRFEVGRSAHARLEGRLLEAQDGSTVLLGRLKGAPQVGVALLAIWLFSLVFVVTFTWAAIEPSLSDPPVPPWLPLVPIAIDAVGLLVVEIGHAARSAQWEALSSWLESTAQLVGR